MKATDIVLKLDDLFDQFGIDRLPSVWKRSDDILIEIEGTNFYVQYDPEDKWYYLLEVKNHGGSSYVQETQDWITVASSDDLVDIFKAYIVEEVVQFSDESLTDDLPLDFEQSSTL